MVENKKILNLEKLKEILGTTVKKDDENKLICFLLMLNTYTDEDQTNIGFVSPSSTGKSYIPLELANGYFPKEDILTLGYITPQSFFHETGELIPDPTDKEGKRKIKLIDLSKKIIIFIDQPHPTLLTRLRPLLSHDKKIIENKIVDKRQNSGYRTKTVQIKGFPTVFFCSANSKMDEQEKTRFFLLSPEISNEKLKETISLKIKVESDRKKFKEQLESNPDRAELAKHVKAIKENQFKQVIISEELQEKIRKEFLFNREFLLPRYQRDVGLLITLIKAHTLFNYYDRKRSSKDDKIILADDSDVESGIKLYRKISQSNELGLTPDVFKVYNRIIVHLLVDGFNKMDFQNYYYKVYHRPIDMKRTKQILSQLESAGLIIETKDYDDRRMKRYIAPKGGLVRTEQRILAYDRLLGLAAWDYCQLCKKRKPVFRIDAEAYFGKPILLCNICFETAKMLDQLRGITYEDKDKDDEEDAFIGL